jgi:hypothetical protein
VEQFLVQVRGTLPHHLQHALWLLVALVVVETITLVVQAEV